MPTDWELIGRVLVIFGLAGLLGVVGRIAGSWLRAWYKKRGGGE